MGGKETGQGLSQAGSTGDRPLVVILPDPETLAHAVATAILAEARRVSRRSGRFSIALSGGTTPRRAYELLGQSPLEEGMPWKMTEVFWSDERCVEAGDLRSNELMAREALLDGVRIPETQVHPMRCPESVDKGRDGAGESSQAEEMAVAYEKILRAYGMPMDLVLLGLGEDGHTASLFPGAKALAERERWVVPALGGAASGDAPEVQTPLWRVTLTPAYINLAASVFFLAAGATKARAVRQTLEGSAPEENASADVLPEPDLPARLIRPVNGSVCWFLDEAAASKLDKPATPSSTKESSR